MIYIYIDNERNRVHSLFNRRFTDRGVPKGSQIGGVGWKGIKGESGLERQRFNGWKKVQEVREFTERFTDRS